VRGNYFHDTGQVGTRAFPAIGLGVVNDALIANNVFVRAGRRVAIDTGSGARVKVLNNTIYDVSTGIRTRNNSPVEIRNNLLVGTGRPIEVKPGSRIEESHNITTGTARTHFVRATDSFHPTDENYRLKPTSPARDAGLCLAAVPTDKDGRDRPSSGCDVGAYELDRGRGG